MGASGSGKSTLLSVLNGSERPSSGRVVINGIDIYQHPHKVEGVIGFIPQDDLLMEDLTVFQNLYFAAELCFGHYSKHELSVLVERVLINVGLSEIRNIKVGSPLKKTISGGQRKRLNIALELLREPAILFVDEPTSGLSSRDSENIMDLLKELSLRGKNDLCCDPSAFVRHLQDVRYADHSRCGWIPDLLWKPAGVCKLFPGCS